MSSLVKATESNCREAEEPHVAPELRVAVGYMALSEAG